MVNISHRHYLAEVHYRTSGKGGDVKMFSYNYNPSDNVKLFVSGGSGCSTVHGRLLKPRAIYNPQQKKHHYQIPCLRKTYMDWISELIGKNKIYYSLSKMFIHLAILHAVAHNIDSQ